jgi:hypothetical protein
MPFLNKKMQLYSSILSYQIRRLHALLIEQTEITNFSQEEYERLQNVIVSGNNLVVFYVLFNLCDTSHVLSVYFGSHCADSMYLSGQNPM